MNKKRIFIVLTIVIAVTAFTLAPAMAVKNYKTNTIKFKDKNDLSYYKKLGSNDSIQVYYWSKAPKSYSKMCIGIFGFYDMESSGKYILKKAKVKFVKKVNGKNRYISESFKATKYNTILYNPKNGCKPYSVVIYYYKK
jgi:hypothetical protein